MKPFALMMSLFLASSTLAFGAPGQGQGQDQEGVSGKETRALTLQEFKESCLNPAQFHAQRPPQSIKVICGDTKVTWKPVKGNEMYLKGSRVVSTMILSDKYHVDMIENPYDMSDSMVNCPVQAEVERTISIEKDITCNTLLGYKGDLNNFCFDVLEESKNMAEFVQERLTGNVYESCGTAVKP